MLKIIKKILRPFETMLQMVDGDLLSKYNGFVNKDFKCNAKTQRCVYNKKSPYYKYEYFGKNTPICCATHLYEILRDVTKVLDDNNLEYFISFGTLLGAVRHGGMIPWDTDVDIVIDDKEMDKLYVILKNNLTYKYEISNIEKQALGNLIKLYFSHKNSLHIDIFSFIERNDNIIIYSNDYIFLKNDIFPLQKIKYYDLSLFAPKDIEKHLEIEYGNDYMEYAYKQWALNKNKFKITDYSPARIEKQ